MKCIDSCIVCNSGQLVGYPAIVSPFIAQMALKLPPIHCILYECAACSHRFFNLRLENDEMSNLYSNYRGQHYLKIRQLWEPWYTSTINKSIGNDHLEISSRRKELLMFLQNKLPKKIFAGTVLDYGGDRGQFIPYELGSKKFVFEVSDQIAAEGVVRLNSATEIKSNPPDLVILSHVLEHMPYPLEFLNQIKDEIGFTADNWIYVEVPLERYKIISKSKNSEKTREQEREAIIARHRWTWIPVDMYSTFFRVKYGVIPPFGIIKLHEHLNFFSKLSLEILLQLAGFTIESSSIGSFSSSSGVSQVIKVLARLNPRSEVDLNSMIK